MIFRFRKPHKFHYEPMFFRPHNEKLRGKISFERKKKSSSWQQGWFIFAAIIVLTFILFSFVKFFKLFF